MAIWLAVWGVWVILSLMMGLFHQNFAIELWVQNPEAFIPGAILLTIFLISAIYSRNFALIHARKSVRAQRRSRSSL